MVEAARQALAFVAGRSRGDLDADMMLRMALTRAVQIIGEAATRMSAAGRAELPRIPWRQITGMRNRLVHPCFDVDADILWVAATVEVAALLAQLKSVAPKSQPDKAITNQERVGKAMDLLRAGLAPFVEREVQAAAKAGTDRMDAVRRSVALVLQFHLFRLPACKRPAAEPAAREKCCMSRLDPVLLSARPEVKAVYDSLADEFAFLDEILKARTASGLTQADVAQRIGTTQSAIARLESAAAGHSPSIATLQRYARALGYRLEVRLVKERRSARRPVQAPSSGTSRARRTPAT